MTAERGGPDIPEWARAERQSDLAWIAENLPSFWPAAQAQFRAQGRGVVVIDTTIQPDPNVGHPMYYLPQEIAEQTDAEDITRMLTEYIPEREFVVLLLNTTLSVPKRPILFNAVCTNEFFNCQK